MSELIAVKYDNGVTVYECLQDGRVEVWIDDSCACEIDGVQFDAIHKAIHATKMRKVNGEFGKEKK